jgi:hypothetical protein
MPDLSPSNFFSGTVQWCKLVIVLNSPEKVNHIQARSVRDGRSACLYLLAYFDVQIFLGEFQQFSLNLFLASENPFLLCLRTASSLFE